MRALPILVACALSACGSAADRSPSTPSPSPAARGRADAVVYVNANVVTLDDASTRARVLRVEGDSITHVLSEDDDALAGARVDLEGATVVPGLVDAHLHLRSLGRARRQVDLLGTRSADEVIARVREAASRTPAGQWIRGRGWDQNDWARTELPTHEALSAAVPDHPVWLTRVDGHAVWLNARAMELAGVDARSASPAGGEIVRGPDGAPSGVFVDNAMDAVGRALPAASAAEIRSDLRRALELCAAAGLTGVHDMGVDAASLRELRALEAEGQLPLRVTVYLAGGSPGTDALLREPPDREGLLRVVGVKLFADGALGSRGAALFEDYDDRAGHRGALLHSAEELTALARAAHEAGYQIAIHAIGDRGIATAIDAIAAAEGEDRSRRHRIEHVQVIRPSDVARLVSLGIVASMQPTHATSDMPWAEARVGSARIEGAYAWRTMLEAGVPLAFGSDAPVEDYRPALGLYAAVSRQDAEGHPDGGWRPSQRVTIEEALRGFGRGAAFAGGREDLGAIRPGARADLTVLREDPTRVEPRALRELTVLRTIVGGREVYARE